MRLLWIGGNHPRHLYYINTVARAFMPGRGVMEIREHLLPRPPEGTNAHDKALFVEHFARREQAEAAHFGAQVPPACVLRQVGRPGLNTPETAAFVRDYAPDVALVFGCGIIKSPLLEALPRHTLNLHLGLSPRYRGSATLFWPFYFQEPAYAGATFHYLLAEPDAGAVVHQSLPELARGDGIHDVACKVVRQSAADMVGLLAALERQGDWPAQAQRGSGKLFLSTDFRPEHLRVNYDLFGDAMVDHFLDGAIAQKRPTPVRLAGLCP